MAKLTNEQLKTLMESQATTINSNFKAAKKEISGKQAAISDLETIRSGAAKGATALQSVPDTYALKTDIPDAYTKTEADTAMATAVAGASHLKRSIVETLPEVADADENTIYMILKSSGKTGNKYDEYFVVSGAFEKIGDTEVDLTDYAKKADIPNVSDTYSATSPDAMSGKAVASAISDKVTADDVNTAINDVFGNISITAWDDIDITA